MSVSYRAHMILGIALPAAVFKHETIRRGCTHPVEEGSTAKFCAECGQPVWKKEIGEIQFSSPSRQFEVEIPNTPDFERDFNEATASRLVGRRLPDVCDLRAMDLPAIEAALREELTLAGLPADGPFRLHQYRYVSG